MNVDLVLQPGAERNRSMVLYAERLAANQPPEQQWQVRRLPGLPGKLGYRLAEIVITPLAMRRTRSDVVHVVDHAHAAYLNTCPVPGVVTVHDLIPLKWMNGDYETDERMSRRAERWFRWNMRGLSRAAHIICPSQATVNDVGRLLNLDAEVVPNGIDQVFFDSPPEVATEAVTRRLQHIDGPILLQVSSGFFYKNEPIFAAVFARLAARIDGLTWVRLGSPLAEVDRALLQREGLQDRQLDYGPVPVEQLAAIYRRADCLLFPSIDEGFGWPPLEAMAAGCPVVASTGGALAETAGPAALTAHASDVDSLAAHVERVLTDSETAANLVRRGNAHAATFTWERTAARLTEIYRGLAA